jgi:hypothetical protein
VYGARGKADKLDGVLRRYGTDAARRTAPLDHVRGRPVPGDDPRPAWHHLSDAVLIRNFDRHLAGRLGLKEHPEFVRRLYFDHFTRRRLPQVAARPRARAARPGSRTRWALTERRRDGTAAADRGGDRR